MDTLSRDEISFSLVIGFGLFFPFPSLFPLLFWIEFFFFFLVFSNLNWVYCVCIYSELGYFFFLRFFLNYKHTCIIIIKTLKESKDIVYFQGYIYALDSSWFWLTFSIKIIYKSMNFCFSKLQSNMFNCTIKY